MKNFRVLSSKLFFLIQAFVKEMRACIYGSICFTLTIIDLTIVTRKLLGPADLTRAQTLCIYELSEVIMVSENEDFVFAAFYVVLSGFKCFDNGQKLTVVSFVLSLARNHFLQIVGYRVPSAQVGKLTQYIVKSVT